MEGFERMLNYLDSAQAGPRPKKDVLSRFIKTGASVKVIMINGFQMQGVIQGIVGNWIILYANDVQKCVNVQLVSTIEALGACARSLEGSDGEG